MIVGGLCTPRLDLGFCKPGEVLPYVVNRYKGREYFRVYAPGSCTQIYVDFRVHGMKLLFDPCYQEVTL